MDSKVIFSQTIDSLTSSLEELGLYVADCHMEINSSKQYNSLEDLRKDAINKKATIALEVDCFIGNDLWRKTEDYKNPYTAIGLVLTDISEYLKEENGRDT